jgi:hypothetical protein
MKAVAKKSPLQVRVPLNAQRPVGLGDVISRATSALGVKPCAACKKRAAALNKRIVFGRPGKR